MQAHTVLQNLLAPVFSDIDKRNASNLVTATCAAPELSDYSPRQWIRLYGLRVQIEQSFRDLKSHHFGCGLDDTEIRGGARLEILLMNHVLATLMAWLAGLASAAIHETRFRLSLI